MSIVVHIQYAVPKRRIPLKADFQRWVEAALSSRLRNAEVTIRITGENEMVELNRRYRYKEGVTNILSFPFEALVPLKIPFLGDVVICAPVVMREALEQDKNEKSHWAHLVVHGVLHLLGFDHQQEVEAQQMEALEITTLKSLGYPHPYESA
jgi:probable rRNA maturation factor